MSDNFNPDHDAPVRREFCLSLKWFDGDPMPTVCALKHDHAGDHETRLHRFAVGAVDVVTWARGELEEVA